MGWCGRWGGRLLCCASTPLSGGPDIVKSWGHSILAYDKTRYVQPITRSHSTTAQPRPLYTYTALPAGRFVPPCPGVTRREHPAIPISTQRRLRLRGTLSIPATSYHQRRRDNPRKTVCQAVQRRSNGDWPLSVGRVYGHDGMPRDLDTLGAAVVKRGQWCSEYSCSAGKFSDRLQGRCST